MASVDQGEQDDLVVVRSRARRSDTEQYALVLTAMGIQSLVAPDGLDSPVCRAQRCRKGE